jgi:hypothetical protein
VQRHNPAIASRHARTRWAKPDPTPIHPAALEIHNHSGLSRAILVSVPLSFLMWLGIALAIFPR